MSTWRWHRAHRNSRASSIAAPGGEGWTIRNHRAILRSEPYASADLGAASDVTAKSIQSEAAPVSPTPAISPQRHSAVIAPAHGDGISGNIGSGGKHVPGGVAGTIQYVLGRPSQITSRPDLHHLSALFGRREHAWESLLAIGNVAGGEWAGSGGRARRACERVMDSTAGEETGAREMLLADLRTIFEAEGWPAAIGSKAILDKLTAMEGRPWGEWSRGKQLSAHGLSKQLKPFEVCPRKVRVSGESGTVQGYTLAALRPVWGRYQPDTPIPPVQIRNIGTIP